MSVLDKFLDAIKLNDDYDDDEYFDDDLLDEDDFEEEEKPRKKFFEKFSHKKDDSELDDDFLDDDIPEDKPKKTVAVTTSRTAEKTVAQKPVRTSSKITPMRASKKSQSVNMEVCVIRPTSMEDTREIADTLVENATVILNLEGIDVELAQRIIDFTSGACYSLDGSFQQVSSYIFVLGPSNVDITGDLKSILNNSAPSVRAGY